MIKILLILIAHMITFSISMLPGIMVVFYKRLNLGYKYDYQSMLRLVTTAVILIIISVYKVIYIAVYSHSVSPEINSNISLFFALTLLVCTFLSTYFIVDRAIIHFKRKPRRLILNVTAGITILLAIFTIFKLVSRSVGSHFNYIDFAIHYMFPVLTGVLSFAGIISLVFYKRASKQGIIYSYIFVLSIPFIVLDLIFADKSQYLLTCIPYIAFTVAVFIDVFSGSERLSTGINEKEDSLAGKYDLTERELEVYQLASKGLSNQEISEQLFVSVHTVKTHLQHIFTKLNINTKYQLINFSKENEKDED